MTRKKTAPRKDEAELQESRSAADRRIAELVAIIHANPKSLYDEGGNLRRLQDVPEDVRIALKEVDVEPISGVIRKAKFKDKDDALDEYVRLIGRDKDPEIIVLLRRARSNRRRIVAIYEAAKKLTRNDVEPPTRLN